jgi:hypothetical protein
MRWAVPVFALMISARCVPDERAARLECADLPTLSGVYAWVRSPTFHVALATGCATPGPAVIADAEEFASAGHWFESKVFPAASDAGARSSRVVVTGKITLQDDRRSADHDVASVVAFDTPGTLGQTVPVRFEVRNELIYVDPAILDAHGNPVTVNDPSFLEREIRVMLLDPQTAGEVDLLAMLEAQQGAIEGSVTLQLPAATTHTLLNEISTYYYLRGVVSRTQSVQVILPAVP